MRAGSSFACAACVAAAVLMLQTAPSSADGWSAIGPRAAGRLSAIVAHDANTLYVGSPGGGVWKSLDGGAHWSWPGNSGLTDDTVTDLQFDRLDGNRLYARTWNGLWVTTDGAIHWTRLLAGQRGGGRGSNPIQGRICRASDPPSLCGFGPQFIGAEGSQAASEPGPFAQLPFAGLGKNLLLVGLPCGGLQYSKDGGVTWAQIWIAPGPQPALRAENCLNSIAVDEASHRVYVAADGRDQNVKPLVFRSAPWTASGPPSPAQWVKINQGFVTTEEDAVALAWGGTADRVMVVTTGSLGKAAPYLFNGSAWVPRSKGADPCDLMFLMPRPLVHGVGDEFFVGGVQFAYTHDAGASWTCPPLDNLYVDKRGIFASSALHRVWTTCDQSNLGQISVIGSWDWTPGVGLGTGVGFVGDGIWTWQAYSLAVSAPAGASGPRRLYVGAQDVGAACSADSGLTWNTGEFAPESQALMLAPSDANTLYSFGVGEGLVRVDNAGATADCSGFAAHAFDPAGQFLNLKVGPRALAVDPRLSRHAFLASGGGVNITFDGGASWFQSDLPPAEAGISPKVSAVYVDTSGFLYAGTLDHGVYRCTDAAHYCDGGTGAGPWRKWALTGTSTSSPPRSINAIVLEPAGGPSRSYYVATSEGLFRRTLGSTTLTAIQPVPDFVYGDVVVDPFCRSRVYAALGFGGHQSRSGGGVWVSTRRGAPGSWTKLTAGSFVDATPVSELVVDPADPHSLWVSTYGLGIWRYDWGAGLPACQP